MPFPTPMQWRDADELGVGLLELPRPADPEMNAVAAITASKPGGDLVGDFGALRGEVDERH